MHYNGEGKVNAGQMFEVEDKPGVVPQKQVKCTPNLINMLLKRLFPSYKLRTDLSCLKTWCKLRNMLKFI